MRDGLTADTKKLPGLIIDFPLQVALDTLHNRTVLSFDLETMRVPSGENATDRTQSV
jgi:hypothetical protein